MLYAQKDNRQYPITEDEKQTYINQGYRIASLEGDRLVFEKQKPKDLTIVNSLKEQLKKIGSENKDLKAELKEIKSQKQKEIEKIVQLEADYKKLEADYNKALKELDKLKGEGK